MQFTIGVTADTAKAIEQLRAPSLESDPDVASIEEGLRGAIADYLEVHAAEQGTAGVTANVVVNYTPKA